MRAHRVGGDLRRDKRRHPPAAVIGEELAVRAQGRIPERPFSVFVGALFAVISVGFLTLAVR